MSLNNCDNKTWLSSTSYIKSFNKFLIKESKINMISEKKFQPPSIIVIGKIVGFQVNNYLTKLPNVNLPGTKN